MEVALLAPGYGLLLLANRVWLYFCMPACKLLEPVSLPVKAGVGTETIFTFSVTSLLSSPRIFEHRKKWYNFPVLTDFYPRKVT